MTIYSISFNKGDYAYSISYHQGNDDMTLETNEEAKNSLNIAKTALQYAIREYAEVNEIFDIVINKVTFGDDKKDNHISFTASTFSKEIFPKKIINQNMKIAKIRKHEKDIEATRAKVLINIESLYSEVEKYLQGERAQQELDLEDEEENYTPVNENEVTEETGKGGTDMFGFDIFQ